MWKCWKGLPWDLTKLQITPSRFLSFKTVPVNTWFHVWMQLVSIHCCSNTVKWQYMKSQWKSTIPWTNAHAPIKTFRHALGRMHPCSQWCKLESITQLEPEGSASKDSLCVLGCGCKVQNLKLLEDSQRLKITRDWYPYAHNQRALPLNWFILSNIPIGNDLHFPMHDNFR